MINESNVIFEKYIASKKPVTEHCGHCGEDAEMPKKKCSEDDENCEDCENCNKVAPPQMSEGEEGADHSEADMGNPEEKREVVIGKEIARLLQSRKGTVEDYREQIQQAVKLAEELIKMHSEESEDEKDIHDEMGMIPSKELNKMHHGKVEDYLPHKK